MERAARLQGLFYVCQIPHKYFPHSRNFSLLSKALEKEPTSMFPRSGAPMEFPEPYSEYPSGTPGKKPSLLVTLIELPRREIPHSKSPPWFIFQSPRYTSPIPSSRRRKERKVQTNEGWINGRQNWGTYMNENVKLCYLSVTQPWTSLL
jgi:hypothetical protein